MDKKLMPEIMISIRPEWTRWIVSGKKTVEVRRTKPACNTPFKCYIYCTKSTGSDFLWVLNEIGRAIQTNSTLPTAMSRLL